MASSAMTEGETASRSPQPVIVNSSLGSEDVTRHLQLNNQFKVRVTDSTVSRSIIFPKSGVAFLLEPVSSASDHWPPQGTHVKLADQLINRVEKMMTVHGHFYVLLMASLHGEDELTILSALQQQFFNRAVRVIPCHNVQEAVQIMADISKMTGRTEPLSVLLRERIENTLHVTPDVLMEA